jgi:hypothetical protein
MMGIVLNRFNLFAVKSLQSKLKNDTERARSKIWSNLPKHFTIVIIHKKLTDPVYNFLRGVRDNMISQLNNL